MLLLVVKVFNFFWTILLLISRINITTIGLCKFSFDKKNTNRNISYYHYQLRSAACNEIKPSGVIPAMLAADAGGRTFFYDNHVRERKNTLCGIAIYFSLSRNNFWYWNHKPHTDIDRRDNTFLVVSNSAMLTFNLYCSKLVVFRSLALFRCWRDELGWKIAT